MYATAPDVYLRNDKGDSMRAAADGRSAPVSACSSRALLGRAGSGLGVVELLAFSGEQNGQGVRVLRSHSPHSSRTDLPE